MPDTSQLIAITTSHIIHSAHGRGDRTACGIPIRLVRDGGRWIVGKPESLARSHRLGDTCKRCRAMAGDVL